MLQLKTNVINDLAFFIFNINSSSRKKVKEIMRSRPFAMVNHNHQDIVSTLLFLMVEPCMLHRTCHRLLSGAKLVIWYGGYIDKRIHVLSILLNVHSFIVIRVPTLFFIC